MNKTLETYAREQLKIGLAQCTEKQQHLFKQMYSYPDLDKPIDAVVDAMPVSKLNWAMQQVERTLEKAAS